MRKEVKKTGQELLLEIYETGDLEVNGNKYKINKLPFKKTRKLFSYSSTIANELMAGQFGFMDDPKFEEIEALMMDYIDDSEGMSLSKNPSYWEEHQADYLIVFGTAISAMTIPLQQDVNGK